MFLFIYAFYEYQDSARFKDMVFEGK